MVLKAFQCDINPDTVNIATIVRSFPRCFETLVGYCLGGTGSEGQLSLLFWCVGGGFGFYVCLDTFYAWEQHRLHFKYICLGENKEREGSPQP